LYPYPLKKKKSFYYWRGVLWWREL